VPASSELLFGQIAIGQKFCTPGQVDECARLQLQMQSPHQPAPKLGEILVEKGYLTRDQVSKALEIQKQKLNTVDPLVKQRKEAVLFGKMAVRQGLATQEEVDEGLRLQAQPGEKRSLGEILVAKNFLTAVQVKELLGRQLKKVMHCSDCRLTFTVLTLSDRKRIECPRCKAPRVEGRFGESTRTDAEFATQILRAVKAGLSSPDRDSRVIPAPSDKLKVSCIVCDQSFEAPLDTTGRVRCPSCHSTFTPR
jgi:Zn finger protein HypA/HybF involved in hydrogenase expression